MKRTSPLSRVSPLLLLIACVTCGDDGTTPGGDGASTPPPGETPGSGTTPPPGGGGPGGGELPAPRKFTVDLEPEAASTAPRRVNFAVPLPPGLVTDVKALEVTAAGTAVATARRAIATWPDKSLRSVQLQVELAVPSKTTLEIEVGKAASGGDLALVPVEQTLAQADGTTGPSVWAVLPATWLAASRFAGPALPSADVAGTPAAAWDRVCDYGRFGKSAFQAAMNDQGSWLFDRPTALYRGYQRTGSLAALRSAFQEAAIYRARITGSGRAARIGVPGVADDLKYHYTQGLALHYLLTGDDRFREAAESVALRAHDLWTDPGYAGGADFWTERHAGFALLAYEWAVAVSDDQAAQLAAWANEAAKSYLALQASYPPSYTNANERCFAHTAEAHGEDYGYVGCSPWMSAILADALDTNADRRAREGDAAGAQEVRASLVKLGRFVATQGRDSATGRPYYWAGVGTTSHEADDYDEHWGESAYLVALAWHWSGKTDASLKRAAEDLVKGLDDNGEAGQLRSFNWQCRTGPVAPFYLRP